MNTRKTRIAALVLAITLSGTAQAALEGRDLNGSADSFEAYYDTDLNVTWLADANYAKTSGQDADGKMTYIQATIWAYQLSIVDSINNITYADWRLPTTLEPDGSCALQSGGASDGYGCTGSEMGQLFHSELGGSGYGQSILMSPDPDLAKFANLQASSYSGYWSDTEYPIVGTQYIFSFSNGYQDAGLRSGSAYALLVSPGDVAITAVPEPETYAMMLAGLALVGAMARRRKQAKI